MLCIYSFVYWKSGTNDILVLLLFAIHKYFLLLLLSGIGYLQLEYNWYYNTCCLASSQGQLDTVPDLTYLNFENLLGSALNMSRMISDDPFLLK